MFRDKALMIADDEHGEDFTVLVSNLTDEEKVKLFNALDAGLHENTCTNVYMLDKISYLEGQIEDFIEPFKYNEDSEFDGEYDFYEK
jgi:hypothetical protein